MDRDKLICEHFKLGLKYQDILQCMETIHGFVFNLRILKRITKRMGLYRNKFNSYILEVALFLVEQCAEHGSLNNFTIFTHAADEDISDVGLCRANKVANLPMPDTGMTARTSSNHPLRHDRRTATKFGKQIYTGVTV